MTFEEWVDENVKYIRTPDIFQWLSEAWDAGAKAECEKLKNVAIYDMWLKERDLSVEAAILAEREACAKVCEETKAPKICDEWSAGQTTGCSSCAAAIRAR